MFLYKIQNLIDKKIYVGATNNIKRRWKEHKTDLKADKHDNPHLQSAWNKYGKDNFKFEIINEFDNLEALMKAEIEYIETNNLQDAKNGYNLAKGGAGTFSHTEESRNKISRSQEKAVIGKCLKTGVEKIYQSISSVREDGFNPKAIGNACVGRSLTYKKYVWAYLKDFQQNPSILLSKFENFQNTKARPARYKKIFGMHIKTKQCVEYEAVYHAVKDGFAHQTIHRCCTNPGVYKSHKNYVWSFDKAELMKKYKIALSKKTHKVEVS